MSLLLSGVQRFKAFVLIAALLVASTLLGASPASATEGVTGSPTNECTGVVWPVTNNTSQEIKVFGTVTRNDHVFSGEFPVAPGVTTNVVTATSDLYWDMTLTLRVGQYVDSPSSGVRELQWTDWGTATYTPPSSCPMIAPLKMVTKQKLHLISGPRPIFKYRTAAYLTDFGYRIVGQGAKIRWANQSLYANPYTSPGSKLNQGQKVKIVFYSRNRDADGIKTKPTSVGYAWFKRAS